jgi:hypothetical protein
MLLKYTRVMVDRVSLLAAQSPEAANTNGGPFLTDPAILQISHQDPFKLADDTIMGLNQTGKVPHTATNVHRGCRIWDLNGIEDNLDAFIRLEFLRNMRNDQRAGVEREGIFWRAEELRTKAHHGGPVKPNDDYDNTSDDIDHADVSPEKIAFDITNGEHRESIATCRRDVTEIVRDIDRDKDGASQYSH